MVVVGALSVGASSAAALSRDWTVNGVPLRAGEKVSVKFANRGAIELSAPSRGVRISCSQWKASGVLVGGEVGGGELASPKLSKCRDLVGEGKVKAKFHEPITLKADFEDERGTLELELGFTLEFHFRKGGSEEFSVAGIVDSRGPAGSENLFEFPKEPLAASTLKLDGSFAVLSGEAALTLPHHATLGDGVL